jgi:Zn-dependent protease
VNFSEIVIALVAAILAITLHELAHGFCALALGDDTARRAGRLSLNPLAHVDTFGTIILPGILLIGQLLTIGRVGFMFGWAKPVPVAAWKFRNPRRAMMIVAAAGPAMNFLLAWLTALIVRLLPSLPPALDQIVVLFAESFILYNLVLGLFNLLPIPPLDGGRIVVGLLPEQAARSWARLEKFGIVLVLLVVFLLPRAMSDIFGVHFDPVGAVLNTALPRVFDFVLWLAGNDTSG